MKKIVLVLVFLLCAGIAMAEDITLTVDVAKMITPAVRHLGEIPLDE